MEKRKMLVDQISEEIMFCARCMMCKAVCTTHAQTRWDQHAPQNRAWMVEVIRRGLLDFDEGSVANMYQCTQCRLCTEWCVTKQDVANIMAYARADLVNLGMAPQSVLEVDANLDAVKNPSGEAFEKRFTDIDLSGSKENGADVVYFVGCTSCYNHPEIPTAMQKIFDVAGVNYTVMDGEEWCCGLPAYEVGLWERATEMARHNVDAIKATGVKTVVASCPGCARALKLEYEKWGVLLDVEVLHHTEFIDKLLKEEKLKLVKPLDKVVTYHDPCHLGRYLGVYDAPRDVLKNIPSLKLEEMWFKRERALCCGAGGGYRFTNIKTAIQIEEKVPKEASRINAEILATACPTCKLAFNRPVRTTKNLELKDIAEIVADAL